MIASKFCNVEAMLARTMVDCVANVLATPEYVNVDCALSFAERSDVTNVCKPPV